ncbi:uncharacterized protein K452DRAFT_333374 [Aplosporella prunicola CBS 121167]|uniref:Uncharacterized protein n=1 Tax=Aplosporella prunicola CBS 121167 TaxID=1176127 RepID=A0A6A6BBX2_9PEZI|nr:uncharacterized protein K452DRAFT_333374 [Aplosporella prunicola CBS 121167]KAF2141620.1 hypothetical protein K452DRAFT_333374 [Aplosporella prunicola CBS 121167]
MAAQSSTQESLSGDLFKKLTRSVEELIHLNERQGMSAEELEEAYVESAASALFGQWAWPAAEQEPRPTLQSPTFCGMFSPKSSPIDDTASSVSDSDEGEGESDVEEGEPPMARYWQYRHNVMMQAYGNQTCELNYWKEKAMKAEQQLADRVLEAPSAHSPPVPRLRATSRTDSDISPLVI